jgi:hypothetical protein
MMKYSRIYKMAAFTVLGIVSMFFAAKVVLAATVLDFELHNSTGKDIYGLYCAPHSDDEWGPDILGKDVVINGDAVKIDFSEGTQAPTYDLKVEFADKVSAIWGDLDLKDFTDLTLTYHDGKPYAQPVMK